MSTTTATTLVNDGDAGHQGPASPSLRRNFSWTLAGNLIYAVCQWGILVVLAKLGSPELVGVFALALAVTTPVIMFANLQLRTVQATDARKEFTFGDYFALRMLTTIAALMVIVVLTFSLGFGRDTAAIIILIGSAKAFESFSDAAYGLFQQNERMDLVSRSMIAKGLLSLLAFGAAVYHTGSLTWGALSLVLSWGALLLIVDLPAVAHVLRRTTGESVRLSWRPQLLWRLFLLALPLGFVTLMASLNVNVPRLFLARIGERELGIFAGLSYVYVIGARFLLALCKSAEPRLAKLFVARDTRAFWSLGRRITALALVVGIAGVVAAVVAGRPILILLYGQEYADHNRAFVLIMIASALAYVAVALQQLVIASRRFRAQVTITTLTSASVLLLSFLLIPRFGIVGAAVAVLASQAIELIASAIVAWHPDTNPDFQRRK